MIGLNSLIRSKKKLPETEEIKSPPPTEYPVILLRAIKDVKILDEEGNALISWRRTCRNNCEKELPKIVNEGRHDGTFKSCKVRVNGKRADYFVERYKVLKENGEEEEMRLSNRLKLTINLEKEKIGPDQLFEYSYTVEYEGVFEKAYQRDAEWTSYEVLVPTNHLTIVIMAPESSKFDPKGSEVRVKGLYEIEDFREEQRCRDKYPPIVLQDGDLLMWEIRNPKIACTYSLHFGLIKRRPRG